MIEAMKNISAQLLIIGAGDLKETLQASIKKNHLENKVFLLGSQQNPFQYLLNADCFLFTSNHEGVFLMYLLKHLPVNCQLLAPIV